MISAHPVREILRPNQGIIPLEAKTYPRPVTPTHRPGVPGPVGREPGPVGRETDRVPRARSGASRGKVCYRVLAASAVLVCTCSRPTLRVATSRAAAALARCSIVCRGAHALLCGQVRH